MLPPAGQPSQVLRGQGLGGWGRGDRVAEWALALKASSTLEIPSMPRHRVGLALAAKNLGDAKVSNLDNHAMFVKKDILGFEVPVQDEVGVHVMQCEQDLHKEVQDGLLLQQGITALLDELSQGAACSSKGLVKIQSFPGLDFPFMKLNTQIGQEPPPITLLGSEFYTSDLQPSPFQGTKMANLCLSVPEVRGPWSQASARRLAYLVHIPWQS